MSQADAFKHIPSDDEEKKPGRRRRGEKKKKKKKTKKAEDGTFVFGLNDWGIAIGAFILCPNICGHHFHFVTT